MYIHISLVLCDVLFSVIKCSKIEFLTFRPLCKPCNAELKGNLHYMHRCYISASLVNYVYVQSCIICLPLYYRDGKEVLWQVQVSLPNIAALTRFLLYIC